jgi:hypothetical protein
MEAAETVWELFGRFEFVHMDQFALEEEAGEAILKDIILNGTATGFFQTQSNQHFVVTAKHVMKSSSNFCLRSANGDLDVQPPSLYDYYDAALYPISGPGSNTIQVQEGDPFTSS